MSDKLEELIPQAHALMMTIQGRENMPGNPARIEKGRLIVEGLSADALETMECEIGKKHFSDWSNGTQLLIEQLDRLKLDIAETFQD